MDYFLTLLELGFNAENANAICMTYKDDIEGLECFIDCFKCKKGGAINGSTV